MNINFDNVQGNILKGFNKDNVRLIFFNIESKDGASKWFRSLVEQKKIPSTNDLIESSKKMNEKWNSGDPNFKPRETWFHVAFSANGIKKFGLELPPSHNAYGFQHLDPNDPKDPEPVLQDGSVVVDENDPFNAGMKKRASILGDKGTDDPSNWIEPFNQKSGSIDGVLRIDSDEPEDADTATVDLISEFNKRGIAFVGLLKGTAIYNMHHKQIEHFGFRDGVSQPLFEGIDDDEIKKRKIEKDVHDPKKFVLFDLKGKRSWANDGSFMVVRRLSQDFPGFWMFMEQKSKETKKELGLSSVDLAARFVGRWPSGAPLAKFQDGDPVLPAEFDDNDFKYLDNKEEDSKKEHPELNDPRGEKTPRFAHIRKVYPRDDGLSNDPETNDKQVDTHRIIRRGIAFGARFEDDEDGERGLIFMCYQLDLANQFEFIQRQFANNPDFPLQDPQASEGHGIDAIIGKHDKAFVNFLKGNKFKRINGFKEWVTTTGGEYFFSPSLNTLKSLPGG